VEVKHPAVLVGVRDFGFPQIIRQHLGRPVREPLESSGGRRFVRKVRPQSLCQVRVDRQAVPLAVLFVLRGKLDSQRIPVEVADGQTVNLTAA
jgi:hypothetical protein